MKITTQRVSHMVARAPRTHCSVESPQSLRMRGAPRHVRAGGLRSLGAWDEAPIRLSKSSGRGWLTSAIANPSRRVADGPFTCLCSYERRSTAEVPMGTTDGLHGAPAEPLLRPEASILDMPRRIFRSRGILSLALVSSFADEDVSTREGYETVRVALRATAPASRIPPGRIG